MQSSFWNLDRVMKLLFASAGCAALFWLLSYLADVLLPFGIAFLFAYMLDPLVCLVQRKVRSRAAASLLVLGTVLVGTLGAMFLLAPAVTRQAIHLGDMLATMASDSTWQERLSPYLPAQWKERLAALFSEEQLASTLRNADFWTYAQAILSKLLPGAMGVLSGSARLIAWCAGAVMIGIYLVFILIEFPSLRAQLASLVPNEYKARVFGFAKEFNDILGKYFRAQTLVSACMGILFALGFSILGLPLAIPFGLFIGLLSMVPYLQLASVPPAMMLGLVYTLDTGMPYWQTMLIILAIYGMVQLVQDLVLTPRIMGEALGLSPVAILLSLSVWGKLLGLFGMLMAIPFTCVLATTWNKYRRERSNG